jgi:hypothetical protein
MTGEEKSETRSDAKMIMPPPPTRDDDMELAIKAVEFALAVMQRHSCWPTYCKEPPIPGPFGTQVDVGEDTERTEKA